MAYVYVERNSTGTITVCEWRWCLFECAFHTRCTYLVKIISCFNKFDVYLYVDMVVGVWLTYYIGRRRRHWKTRSRAPTNAEAIALHTHTHSMVWHFCNKKNQIIWTFWKAKNSLKIWVICKICRYQMTAWI